MGIIDQLDTAGALPALDRTIRFAGARHTVIAHNIANLETPDFQPRDVDPHAFQATLAEAIDARRTGATGVKGGGHGELAMDATREVERLADGSLRLNPRTSTGNILFHDRNNRDLERTMQSLVENASVFRVATDLYRNRTTLLRDAMAERVG
jgi:flagellar basal-body rod protein FlgB